MPSRFVVPETGLALRSGSYPWTVLIAAFFSCLVTLAAYALWGPALALQLAAHPLSVADAHDDFGASVNRAAMAGLKDQPEGVVRVFLMGTSYAAAAFASPDLLSAALIQPGGPKIEVVLLAYRGQTSTGTVALASLAQPRAGDVIVLGMTDFDLLGTSSGRLGNFDVFGRLIPAGARICQIRSCPANEIFLLQRSARAILGNLMTGRRPAPVSGLYYRDEGMPLLSVQKERLVRSLTDKLRVGVDPEQSTEFEAMLSDLLALTPGQVVAVRLPVSSDLVLSDRQAGVVSAGRATMQDRLAKAGVPVFSALADAQLAPEDFSDVLHVWPDLSPHLLRDILAPALLPYVNAEPNP
jgi:hypothetical protein